METIYKTVNSFDTPAQIILRDGVRESDLYPGSSLSVKLKTAFSKEGFKRFIYVNFPNKDDTKKEVVRKIIMDVSFIALLASLIFLAIYYVNYRKNVAGNNDLIGIYNEYDNLSAAELEAAWRAIKEKYPDVDFPEGMNIKFAQLYAINSDVAGRLSVPNTNIDTVLVQTTNNSYYLHKDYYGETSRYGMPFVNYGCSVGKQGLSRNTIIYGHNTHDGLMFHQLTNYMTVEGYKAAPVVTLETLYEKTSWKVFAVILTNATSDLDNGNIFNCLYPEYTSQSQYASVLSGILERSMIHTDVDVNTDDKILSLYTCYQNIFKGGRLIVFARQVREGEDPNVDTSGAFYNSSARFPQAYYDKMGYTNPYA